MTLSKDAPVYRVSLLKSVQCAGCPLIIRPRKEAVFFDHEHVGGYYHHEGEVEAMLDYWLESGREWEGFSELEDNTEEDPIVKKIRKELGINHNKP